MGSWLKVLLVAISLTWAETKGQTEANNQAPNRCGQEECEKFQGCLETLETTTTIHKNVNTLVSKRADQFYLQTRYTYNI